MVARVTHWEFEPSDERAEAVIRRNREEVMPAARGLRGLRAFYSLVDRSRGRALTVTIWESEDAEEASRETAMRLRSQTADITGIAVVTSRFYDEARSLWNAAVDRRPAAVLRCAGTEDVRSALEIAAEQSLEIAVRAGGHSVSGKSVCDGGLVIDLSRLKRVRVEPNGATANVQPGVTLGELVAQIEPRGFLTTTGIVSNTGLSGLTLGGGIGWLMGRYGLACDNLLSAEVVTADRRLLRAATTENPDLLWALRGGGGNFGVVTSFTFRLHRSEPILSGMVLHSIDAAVDVLRFYREYTAAAPDGLTANAALLTSPDGYLIAGVAVCWCGPEDEGERVLAPLRRFGPPVVDTISRTPYAAAIRMMDEAAAPGLARQYRSGALVSLTTPLRSWRNTGGS